MILPDDLFAEISALCLDAVQVSALCAEAKKMRAARLLRRRDIAYRRLRETAASAWEYREWMGRAANIFAAALMLLGEVAAIKKEKDSPVYCGTAPFDGKKTLDEIALDTWAQLPFLPEESPDLLEKVRFDLQKQAALLLAENKIKKADLPELDENALFQGFRAAGVKENDCVMLHASLSSLGRVRGGAPTVIAALQKAVGDGGILAMPALSNTVDAPGDFEFDPATTPIVEWIGVMPRTFWKMPGVLRSANPTHSVLAWGRNAAHFIAQQDPYDCFAPDGPWAKLRDGNGKILLVGENAVDSNTFLHACEAWYTTYMESIVVRVKGVGKVKEFHYPGGCRGNWYHLGKEAKYFQKLVADGIVHTAKIGESAVTVFNAEELARAMQKYLVADPALLLHHDNCGNCAKLRSRIK